MNLIQTIMSTNFLNNFLTIFFTFLEVFLYLKILTATLSITPSHKDIFTYTITTGCIALFTNHFLNNPYSYLINIVSWFIIIHFLFKQNIKNCIIALTVTYTSIFISTFTIQLILKVLFNISYNNLAISTLSRFCACTLICYL